MRQHFDVLVVDDEPVVAAAAVKILRSRGLSVDVAADAETGMQKIEDASCDLVLCDLMLPRIDGFELIAHVRKHLPAAPVVLITGYATRSNAVEAFRRGAFDFIPKPFDCDELQGVVHRGLRFAKADSNLVREIDREDLALADAPSETTAGDFHVLGRHAWAVGQPDGSTLIGMGESFAALGDRIREARFPDFGDDILQGNRCVRMVDENDLVYRMWAPLSGRVIGTHDRVFTEAEAAGWSALCRKWVVRIIASNLDGELPNLTRR